MSKSLSTAASVEIYKDASARVADRADDLVARMTLEEKAEQLAGRGIGASEFGDLSARIFGTAPNQRLGIPQFVMGHGITGVRSGRDEGVHSTYMMAPIGIAASWDRELYRRASSAVAREMVALGQHLNLGTTLNIIRHPLGGRNWECFSEDPFLTARLGVVHVQAMQANGVVAGPKHYVANNQERNRFDINNEVDERTLREIYLPAFKAAVVEGGALNIMGSYNRLNGTFMCQNKRLLTDILRKEWGFDGFVLSDFSNGVRATVPAIDAGLNVEMHSPKFYGETLVQAVRDGEVDEARVDELLCEKLRVMFTIGLFDGNHSQPKSIVHCETHQQLALDVAREAAVLLKNEDSILPLNRSKIKQLAVIGPNAKRYSNIPYTCYLQGGGSGQIYYYPDAVNNPVDEISKLAEHIEVVHMPGCTAPNAIKEKEGEKTPREQEQIDADANADKGMLQRAVGVAARADAVVLVVGLNGDVEAEGWDRAHCRLPGRQEELVRKVAAANANTVVVVVGGSYVEMADWIDSVKGVIYHFYCGEKIGQAMAETLFGEVNPSGKLPISYPKSCAQYPEGSIFLGGPYEIAGKSNVYSEGVYVGYRHFDKEEQAMLFPFGHGLSYTSYKYSNLKVTAGDVVSVEVTVTNAGPMAGDEIVQLYVRDVECSVPRPVRELKGFERIFLMPGESEAVRFELNNDAFSFWCTKKKAWTLESGYFEIQVGASSRDIRLTQTVEK